MIWHEFRIKDLQKLKSGYSKGGNIMNLYEIEMEMKQRQNELDKELKRIQLLRAIKKSHVDIKCEPRRNWEGKDMNIRDYWIRFLYRVATGTRKTRKIFTPVGLMIFGAFTSLFVVLAIVTDRCLLLSWPFSLFLSGLVAILLIVPGVALIFWSAFHFLKMKGTPVPFNPPAKLVKTGPYRFARNPMLTGIFIMLFGIGFAIKSPSLICLFTPLYIWANVWELKQIEEPELQKRLGEDYVAYQQQTPMFLPTMHC
jgi:protein-S-isoprenylcysteine O-methyltransferase Ste14